MPVLAVFLIVVTKCLKKLWRAGFILGSQLEDAAHHGRKVWRELKADDHTAFAVGKPGEMDAVGPFLSHSIQDSNHGMVLTTFSLLEVSHRHIQRSVS